MISDGGRADDSSSEDGKQGIPAATFSLVKACVGSGVLALPGESFLFFFVVILYCEHSYCYYSFTL